MKRKEKNAKQKMQNKSTKVYAKFKIFNCVFFEYNGSSFFVIFVNTNNYMRNFCYIRVSFSMIFSENLGNNLMFAEIDLSY